MANSRTIEYINYDFNTLRDDLVTQLTETNVFKDVNIAGSNIRTFLELSAYIGSLNGYYINSAANEVFLPTAKRYNNLNKIGQLLHYDARGVVSSEVDILGNLNPEYVFGKVGEYIEIPAYSIFPSTKPTKDGENFVFTNKLPVVYIVKGFGISELSQEDIKYKGYDLPIIAPESFFKSTSGSNAVIYSEFLELPLNITKPLSIIVKNSPNNYRQFDTENYPLVNPSDSTSVGQPFTNTVFGLPFTTSLSANIEYNLLFKYDNSTSTANLEIVTDSNILSDRQDDIIGKLVLEPYDTNLNTYKLSLKDISTHNRFYTGCVGMQNLESVSITYDTYPSTNLVSKINLNINKDGNSLPYTVLINGTYYTFNSGIISSQQFPKNMFDVGVEYYNVNLTINDVDKPEINYLASLDVTSKEPVSNQVTIARIYTKNTDLDSNTKSLQTTVGAKYGNLAVAEKITYKTTNEKSGKVYISKGQTQQSIIFNKIFVPNENETQAKYQIQLSSDRNVRKWYSNQSDLGFTINIEPDTDFEGYVNWHVIQIVENKTKKIPIVFNSPLQTTVTIDNSASNYMVQLTPNDNIEVWYENLTENGFDIITEKNFEGKISWSVYNFFDNQSSPIDVENTYRQSNKVVLIASEESTEVTLDIPFPNNQYAIQLVPNNNINVWYTNKSEGSFTINKEPGIDIDIVVDWYVDGSAQYQFQQHGEVDFSGRTIVSQQIPGFRFVNINETFDIKGLIQGSVGFTYVNINNVIDINNNFLELSLDPTKIDQNSLSFIIRNRSISTNSIRVFVKNDDGNWVEWERTGTGFDALDFPGYEVFRVYVNEDKFAKIEFGDGINWGQPINGREMFIIGLQSVGSEGNIGKNIISPTIIASQYILGNDKTNIDFEKSLTTIIGLKSKLFFENGESVSSILDSESTVLRENDLFVSQNKLAIGGADVETVDEIRNNIANSFVRQNRNVSSNDLSRYILQTYYSYIAKCVVINYDQLKEENIISDEELEKYWFNYVFVIGLNKDGSNIIPKALRDTIVTSLNSQNLKMIGKQHEILPASWIPIDIVIKYKRDKTSSPSTIETTMKSNLIDYFSIDNHELGDTIPHSDIVSLVKIDGVSEVEVMLTRDPNNTLGVSDYKVSISNTNSLKSEERNKIMELVAKDPTLIKIFQPAFKTINNNGTFNYSYSLDISLKKYEFPKLGDIIIERMN